MRTEYSYEEVEKEIKGSDLDIEQDFEQYLGNMNDTVKGLLNGYGLLWDDEKRIITVTKGMQTIKDCEHLFDVIDDCYDGLLSESDAWHVVFDLGGDDDVDYNSSYPSPVVMAIERIMICELKRD